MRARRRSTGAATTGRLHMSNNRQFERENPVSLFHMSRNSDAAPLLTGRVGGTLRSLEATVSRPPHDSFAWVAEYDRAGLLLGAGFAGFLHRCRGIHDAQGREKRLVRGR